MPFLVKYKNGTCFLSMKLYSPDNPFTRLLLDKLKDKLSLIVEYLPSVSIKEKLLMDSESVSILPVLDLIKTKDVFISKDVGISFEFSLSNAFYYFNSENDNLDIIQIRGDISSTEVILSKILFSEIYDKKIQIVISPSTQIDKDNILLVGSGNFQNNEFLKGMSFTDQIVETIGLPFVNFVIASQNSSLLNELNRNAIGVSDLINDSIENSNYKFPCSDEFKQFIKENADSLVYELDHQDIEGINQILRLPYYHGVIQDIVELNFI